MNGSVVTLCCYVVKSDEEKNVFIVTEGCSHVIDFWVLFTWAVVNAGKTLKHSEIQNPKQQTAAALEI